MRSEKLAAFLRYLWVSLNSRRCDMTPPKFPRRPLQTLDQVSPSISLHIVSHFPPSLSHLYIHMIYQPPLIEEDSTNIDPEIGIPKRSSSLQFFNSTAMPSRRIEYTIVQKIQNLALRYYYFQEFSPLSFSNDESSRFQLISSFCLISCLN